MTQLKPCRKAISYLLTVKEWSFIRLKNNLFQTAGWSTAVSFLSPYVRVRLTCQELVQGLSVHVPALGFLGVIDNLKGLICFGSNHHACGWQRDSREFKTRWHGPWPVFPQFVSLVTAPGVASLSCQVGLWSSKVCSMTYMVSANKPPRKM